jgi:hypothetical protein
MKEMFHTDSPILKKKWIYNLLPGLVDVEPHWTLPFQTFT